VENIDRFGRSVEPGERLGRPWARIKGEVMYFPGCIGELRITEMFESSVGVLEKLGADLGVPESWVCCGAPLEKIGDEARLKDLKEANLLRFEGFDEIVTSCPGCTTHLLVHYGLEPLHTIEFMRESSSLSKLRSRGSGRRTKVALHRPCHLARTIGPQIVDYAYDLLQMVPGIEVVEMEDPGACCGGGGGVVAGYPDIALHLAMEKMANVERAGAEIILAPCPFCVLNLRRVGGSKVQELVSFLNAHLE